MEINNRLTIKKETTEYDTDEVKNGIGVKIEQNIEDQFFNKFYFNSFEHNAKTIKSEEMEKMEVMSQANECSYTNFICKKEVDDEDKTKFVEILIQPKTEIQCEEVCYDTFHVEPNLLKSEVDEKIDISEITLQSSQYNDDKLLYEDQQLRTFASKQSKKYRLPEQNEAEINIDISSTEKKLTTNMKCQFCIKSFAHQKSLDEHLLKQHEQKIARTIYICNACSFKTTSKYKLEKHFNSCHNEQKTKIKCQICDKSFKLKTSLDHHLLTQHKQEMEGDLNSLITNNIYKCNTCSYQTTIKYCLEKHLNSVHNEQKTKINCQLCDKSFVLKRSLGHHLLNEHKQETNGGLESLITCKIHKCNMCSYKTTLKCKYDTHVNTVHKEQSTKINCPICKKSFILKSSLDNHLLYRHKPEIEGDLKNFITSKIHECNFCSYKTTLKYKYENHVNTVHGEKTKINCQMCDKSFSKKRSLDHHLLNKHKQEIKGELESTITSKIHKCTSCSYKSTNKNDLNRHFNSVHNEQRTKYNCQMCEKSFTKQRSLDHHMLKQHKQKIKGNLDSLITSKIYNCNICSFNTTLKYRLDKHFNLIHNEERSKIQCQMCDKSFVFKSSLDFHMLKEHEHEMKSDLKSLITTKVYKCYICQKQLVSKQSLDCHLLSQHKEVIKGNLESLITSKIYNCEGCSYQTTVKNWLDRHFNSVHNKEKKLN